jgi:hypothetical protein
MILHWLVKTSDPFELYGWWPTVIWLAYIVMVLFGFAALEWIGLRRVHGAVPATWIIRCGPRLGGIVLFVLAIWHFVFVATRVK